MFKKLQNKDKFMEKNQKIKLSKEQVEKIIGERLECILDDSQPCNYCGKCLFCDLDPNKICDNCGKCLDTINTDEKGFVKIPIDKIVADDDLTLEELYKQYGLEDEEGENKWSETVGKAPAVFLNWVLQSSDLYVIITEIGG